MSKLHLEEILNEARKALYQHGYEEMVAIGDGGFASIYKVKNRQYQEEFVVKLIDLSLDESKALPESFRAEIVALTNIYHPHVIKIFDYFTSATLLYIILEYCPGGSLMEVVCGSQKLREPIIASIFYQLVSAIQFCHRHDLLCHHHDFYYDLRRFCLL